MNHPYQTLPSETPATPRHLLHTALLGAGILLVPLLLGILFVLTFRSLTPARTHQPAAAESLTNRLDDASVTNVTDLFALRREARSAGVSTDEIDLRIWAAHATQPAALFHVAPPEPGKRWKWNVSQDGRYAVAVSAEGDELERRRVGLFDLVAEDWLWQSTLPWPDAHEAPYVLNRHLVLRYVKKAAHFALEVSPEGRIAAIDRLPASASLRMPAADLRPQPGCPGTPVAVRNGVLFVTDTAQQSLAGYARERLPGLRYAGKGDDNTLFSGNGLLKFTIRDGCVTVADSLTQTVLQKLSAWQPATNTCVTGALTTHDGSGLNVFLRTEFGGTPAVTREWCVAIATYTGTVIPSFNADALLAKPRRGCHTQALSRDGRWQLSVTVSNDLIIASLPSNREVARVRLGALLGLEKPISHLAFLEEGRHVVLRQGDNFWLLDFAVAHGYADLLARMDASAEALALQALAPAVQPVPANVLVTPGDEPYLEDEPLPDLPAPGPYALRAERCADHQAWPYAAALLEVCGTYSSYDGRAPRVNPLLQARAFILSGQGQKARLTCRTALQELIFDPTDYNRMIRYQLQGLLFAQP